MLSRNKQDYEEIKILHEITRLNSPHLLGLTEKFEDENRYYLVTKLMNGGDLHKYLCEQT